MNRFLAVSNVCLAVFFFALLCTLAATAAASALAVIVLGTIPILSSIQFFKKWNG